MKFGSVRRRLRSPERPLPATSSYSSKFCVSSSCSTLGTKGDLAVYRLSQSTPLKKGCACAHHPPITSAVERLSGREAAKTGHLDLVGAAVRAQPLLHVAEQGLDQVLQPGVDIVLHAAYRLGLCTRDGSVGECRTLTPSGYLRYFRQLTIFWQVVTASSEKKGG